MKTPITLVTAMLAAASFAAPPLELPSLVKPLKKLESSMGEAAKQKKGVTFLLMEPGST